MRLVVIDGSDAGISAGLRARELDPAVHVSLLVADAFPNFSICGLPYYLILAAGKSSASSTPSRYSRV